MNITPEAISSACWGNGNSENTTSASTTPNDKDHRPADAGEARYSGSGASTGWAKVSSWPDKQHLLSVKGHDPKRATDKFDFVNVNATQAEAARRDGVVG